MSENELNISELQVKDETEIISWNNQTHRDIGAKILNEAAKSREEPFISKAFKQEDWEEWFDFLAVGGVNRTIERPKAIKEKAMIYLIEKMKINFQIYNMDSREIRELIIDLPDYLYAYEIRKKLGNEYNEEIWIRKEFILTAVVLFLGGENPTNLTTRQATFSASTFYLIKKYIPQRTIDQIKEALVTYFGHIQQAFDGLTEKVREHGLGFFGDDLTEADIQEMKEHGAGAGAEGLFEEDQ
ncbi:uncharacterized protein I206_101581 [Kwoniella pini CBS 10737]|uniref:Uncharacterized protein n=1 Tax=Kwoniella pini CBS 10737 TaxID=1296096 RepID=A0A1B9HW93_9TREE|nr:uncharacterized protein I206_06449 [Kwoniella pini CBS 10737]OCF47547.1 hypothetical protein I206_06449 [Kwoniella pini CBS 10737]